MSNTKQAQSPLVTVFTGLFLGLMIGLTIESIPQRWPAVKDVRFWYHLAYLIAYGFAAVTLLKALARKGRSRIPWVIVFSVLLCLGIASHRAYAAHRRVECATASFTGYAGCDTEIRELANGKTTIAEEGEEYCCPTGYHPSHR